MGLWLSALAIASPAFKLTPGITVKLVPKATLTVVNPRNCAYSLGGAASEARSVRLQATAAGADGYCYPFRRVILRARGPE